MALAFGVAAALVCAGCGGTRARLVSATTAFAGSGRSAAVATTAATASTTPTNTTATVKTPRGLKATVSAGGDYPVAPTSTKQGFLGITSEISSMDGLTGHDPSNVNQPLAQLVKNLSPGAPPLWRIGGDSTDWDWWAIPGMKTPNGIRYTITPAWGKTVAALLKDAGAKALVGVNLEVDNKRVASYEIKQYRHYLGSKQIYGFELGNEPELYSAYNYYFLADGKGVHGRPEGQYTPAAYARDFSKMAASLGKLPLVAPGLSGKEWLPQLGPILGGLPRIKLATVHVYPMQRCGGNSFTVSDFFTKQSIQGLASQLHGLVRDAGAHHESLRLDETNGISCGGQAGVSNSFAEALWALNVIPQLWRAGVSGVNVQDIDSNWNHVIESTLTKSGWTVAVEPEYYGLLAFAEATPAGSHLLRISQSKYAGFYQFATKNQNGDEHVVLTNVGAKARTVGVTARGMRGDGRVSLLTAKSLKATGGVTLDGQALSASTGALAGTPTASAVKPNAKGVYAVRVPAHAAAILTVGP